MRQPLTCFANATRARRGAFRVSSGASRNANSRRSTSRHGSKISPSRPAIGSSCSKGARPVDTAFGSTISIASRSDGSRGMPTKSASKIITRDSRWFGPAIPPGEMLLEEFLKPMGIGQVDAARRLGISLNRLNEIVLGKRGITADTALRLARVLKTSPQFWMRLQADWDLHEAIARV